MAIAMNYSNNFGFDVIEYVKKLRNVGVSQEIAEVQGQELAHVIRTVTYEVKDEIKSEIKQELHFDDFATKGDIVLVQGDIALVQDDIALVKGDIALVKGDIALVRGEIRESELRLQKEILQSSNKIIIWLGGLLVASGLIQHFFK